MNHEKAIVILACYNERDNIERLINEITTVDAGLNLVVIDDNSPDGTGEVVDEMRKSLPNLDVIHRPGKLGLGTAYLAGFRYALDNGCDLAITMDADFSHQPKYLPTLLELSKNADLVIGSRYVAGGGASGWPLRRKIVSGFANNLVHFVLDISAHDCTSGFRCYRREALETIRPESIQSSGYSFLVEILYRAEKHGLRVAEMPIIFVDREAGVSKINRNEVYKTLGTLGRLRFPVLPWNGISRLSARYGEPSLLVLGIMMCVGSFWLLRRRKSG